MKPEFHKVAPNVKIVYTESINSNDYIAKAIAEKNSNKGTFDVLITGSTGTAQLEQSAKSAKLDAEDISNLANLKSEYKDDQYFAPQIYSAITLAYNTDKIKDAPTSWDVLFSDKYKDKMGVMSNLEQYWAFAAASTQTKKPLDENWKIADIVR